MPLKKIITKYIPYKFFNVLQRCFDIFPFYCLYSALIRLQVALKIVPRLKILYIETTNLCNANCPICPRDAMTRKSGIMDMGLYKKIIDEAGKLKVREVHLQNFGEPLLDSMLSERIRYAKERNLRTVIFTNASLLNENLSKDLILSGLDELNISLDAAFEDTYEKARPGLNFQDLERNLLKFLAARKQARAYKPFVRLVFTRSFQGKEEINAFSKKWKDKVNNIYIKIAHDWSGKRKEYGKKYVPRHFWPCEYLWKSLTILWDGKVTTCCMDIDGAVLLGDAKISDLRQIFNSDKLNHYRKQHLLKKRLLLDLCSTCGLNKPWTI